MGDPTISQIPNARVQVLKDDGSLTLPWRLYLQNLNTSGGVTPADLAALEAAIAAAAAAGAAAGAAAAAAAAEALQALQDAAVAAELALIALTQAGTSGGITSIIAGTGLSGGTITTSGTIGSYFADVRDYGALGDGTTDDTTAFQNAAAAGVSLSVSAGTYKLTGNVTFTTAVLFLNTASFTLTTGHTVAFNGGLEAPLVKLWTLAGTAVVTFSAVTQEKVFPEWWGATAYAASTYPVTSPTNSDTQIQAAIDCGAASVELQGADYYIATALHFLNNYAAMVGVGYWLSRLVIKSHTIDGVVIGPASQPVSTAGFTNYVRVENFVIQRTVSPTSINGNSTGSPTGLRLNWTANFRADRIFSVDHSNSFMVMGNVSPHLTDCYALRTIADNGSGFDFWQAFGQDNSASIGLASGNASVYYQQCTALNVAGAFTNKTFGFNIGGGYSDTFVSRCETASCDYGLQASGTGTSGATIANEDLKITDCTFDACGIVGIRITASNQIAQVIITSCYASSSATCILFDTFAGLATVTGCQITAFGASVTGIKLDGTTLCSGVSCFNNIITDCTNPELLDGCTECRVEDSINNGNYNATAGVYLTANASYCIVTPLITGNASGRSGLGVKVDNGVTFCTIDPSAINPASLTGATANNKVVYNGTQITSPGPFTGNNTVVGWIAAPVAPGTVTSVSLSTPLGGGTVTTTGTLGTSTFTAHGVLVGEGSGAVVATAAGTAGQVLTSNGSSADPTFQAAASGNSWLPVVDGHEPPAFITDGAGNLITIAYSP